MSEKGSVTISIMGKEYKIGCSADEVEGLQMSARYLNQQMNLIKTKGSPHAFETIAVLAALNISHDLIKQNTSSSASQNDSQKELKHLEDKIDKALQRARQLEI
jgi:cell division protein ZapA